MLILTRIQKWAAWGSSVWSTWARLESLPSLLSPPIPRPRQTQMALQQLPNYEEKNMVSSGIYNRFLLIPSPIFLDETYDVKLKNLADCWVGWNLAVEIARIRGICEFQLQRILTPSAAESVYGKSFNLVNEAPTCTFYTAIINLNFKKTTHFSCSFPV